MWRTVTVNEIKHFTKHNALTLKLLLSLKHARKISLLSIMFGKKAKESFSKMFPHRVVEDCKFKRCMRNKHVFLVTENLL